MLNNEPTTLPNASGTSKNVTSQTAQTQDHMYEVLEFPDLQRLVDKALDFPPDMTVKERLEWIMDKDNFGIKIIPVGTCGAPKLDTEIDDTILYKFNSFVNVYMRKKRKTKKEKHFGLKNIGGYLHFGKHFADEFLNYKNTYAQILIKEYNKCSTLRDKAIFLGLKFDIHIFVDDNNNQIMLTPPEEPPLGAKINWCLLPGFHGISLFEGDALAIWTKQNYIILRLGGGELRRIKYDCYGGPDRYLLPICQYS